MQNPTSKIQRADFRLYAIWCRVFNSSLGPWNFCACICRKLWRSEAVFRFWDRVRKEYATRVLTDIDTHPCLLAFGFAIIPPSSVMFPARRLTGASLLKSWRNPVAYNGMEPTQPNHWKGGMPLHAHLSETISDLKHSCYCYKSVIISR